MSRKKGLIALLLIIALIFVMAVAACGDDDDDGDQEEPTAAAVEEEAEEPAAEEEEPAAEEEEVEEPAEEEEVEEPAAEEEEPAAEEEEAEEPAAEEEEMEEPAAEEEEMEEPAAEEEAEEPAVEIEARELIACDEYDLGDMQIGLVTDVGQINDKSFNQSSWEGVLAAELCGASVDYIETQDAADYADNIAEFAENGYDIVVTVGFALGTATIEAAETYPDVWFIGVDQFQGESVDNVVGLVFNEDQSGFLAGVLAARLTETGTIAAVLGTDQVPPVVAFKEGYELGAQYANPDINIISTYHPGAIDQAFTDPEWGATTAAQALDQEADVVFGAGGKTGNGALIEVATAVGEGGPPPFCIGVDTDQWLTVPEAHPCLVSSAMKLLDVGVSSIIASIADETVEPGNYFGQAALAPFHDFEDVVPDDVKAELDEVAAALASGEMVTGYGMEAEEEEAEEPVAEEEEMEEPAAEEEEMEEPAAAGDIIAVATADGRFTTLETVLMMVPEIGETLSAEGPYTIFMPTDEAFGAVSDEVVGALMADPTALVSVLEYHIIEGAVMAADVVELESATTLEGEDLAFSVTDEGAVMLNGTVTVVDTDLEASNGVIHAIDGLLVPPTIQEMLAAAAEEEEMEEPAAEEEEAEEPAEEESAADMGVVTIGLNAEYPPFEFVDEDNEIAGFDVDLMTAVAARAGFEIEWVNTRWDGIFVALASGEFDAVSSAATITAEREEIVDFSNPYFYASQRIAVLEANANTIETPEDLAGLRIGVQSGTTGDIYASEEIEGAEVVRYDEITLAFQALAAGDVDAIVNDGPTSADIIEKNPELGAVLVGEPLSEEYYGVAVQPDLPDLLDAINTALAEMIEDGTYAEIFEEWFGVAPPEIFQPGGTPPTASEVLEGVAE